jgi:hypothetical protein
VIAPTPEAVERLALRAGLGGVRELVPLAGGANNRVFRVEGVAGRAVLKCYFRSPDDPRDRLGTEFAFSRFAWDAGIRCVPRPLVCDAAAGWGLFAFADGERPPAATRHLVLQAAEFVRGLNTSRRVLAASLPPASEACFSLEEHLGVVGGRVNRLAEIAPDSDVDREAERFVRRELLPAWGGIREGVRASAGDQSRHRPLGRDAWCVSPSDFGFHNAVVAPGGRATFLDFEYAGWDDPAKLVCDFFCQPAVPVAARFLDEFARTVLADSPGAADARERVRVLLPVYRLKWVCIRLNAFLPGGRSRRAFAGGADLAERKLAQLAGARTALAAVREDLRVSA